MQEGLMVGLLIHTAPRNNSQKLSITARDPSQP